MGTTERDSKVEDLVRIVAPCKGSKHSKAGHSALSCGRCGGTRIDEREARKVRPVIERVLGEVREEAAARLEGEEVVDEDVVDDLRMVLVKVGAAGGDRYRRAPEEMGEALLAELRNAGYLGDPVRWLVRRREG